MGGLHLDLRPFALQNAVQESLDTAEAVDIMTLAGLKTLWKEHDLNIQGDASHFVNRLASFAVQSLPLQVRRNQRRRLPGRSCAATHFGAVPARQQLGQPRIGAIPHGR